MEKASFKERLFCWKVLAREIAQDNYLIDKAIADSTPEVRQWVARHLPDTDNIKDRLNILLSDTAVRVRYTGVFRHTLTFFLKQSF